jgi:hypothetical protein
MLFTSRDCTVLSLLLSSILQLEKRFVPPRYYMQSSSRQSAYICALVFIDEGTPLIPQFIRSIRMRYLLPLLKRYNGSLRHDN